MFNIYICLSLLSWLSLSLSVSILLCRSLAHRVTHAPRDSYLFVLETTSFSLHCALRSWFRLTVSGIGDAEAVDVERILQLDPKGNIPAFVVNLKKQQAAISLREMRTALSSFVADDDGK